MYRLSPLLLLSPAFWIRVKTTAIYTHCCQVSSLFCWILNLFQIFFLSHNVYLSFLISIWFYLKSVLNVLTSFLFMCHWVLVSFFFHSKRTHLRPRLHWGHQWMGLPWFRDGHMQQVINHHREMLQQTSYNLVSSFNHEYQVLIKAVTTSCSSICVFTFFSSVRH